MNHHYITTPIYYATGEPHLGHAYTSMVASLYRRYHKFRGDQAFLATGTDEHGQKIEAVAISAGIPINTFVEEKSTGFLRLWDALDLPMDAFALTTDADHVAYVQDYWRRLRDRGDIYLGHYEGLYCVDCEQYVTAGEVCDIHRKPLTRYSEPSYFFRLIRYQEPLIAHIEAHPAFITPESRRQQFLSFLKTPTLARFIGIPCVNSVGRAGARWPGPRDLCLAGRTPDLCHGPHRKVSMAGRQRPHVRISSARTF